MTTNLRWRKSSRSGQDTACVELAHTRTAVRDSKNPTGPTLTLDTADLITAIRTGRLDR
ncbi:MAG: DUF397 domain-containing protein [Actinophytocola sp.]|uniref:DUF397 domain-containing protein n=1 Tax=Actinophytocola sp. TaxID=1872138 RepID=UPI003C73DFB4